jgi:hypothetical protein
MRRANLSRDGIGIAREILAITPHHRIIIASSSFGDELIVQLNKG